MFRLIASMQRRLGPAPLRDERGMTLTEVVMVTSILAIVMGFVMSGFVSMQSAATTADIKLQNLDEARTLMDNMTKDIRTATLLPIPSATSPFTLAGQSSMQFYANLMTTGAPNRVDLYVDSTTPSAPRLIEKLTPPDPGTNPPVWSTPPKSTASVRYVGQYVVNGTGIYTTPLFQYYDADGVLIPWGASGTSLDASSFPSIASVQVTLSVRKSTSRAIPATTLVNQVTLPNIYYSVDASPTP
jgi:prepilin-type N-terminal cleavage/methylation domain-containing protein